MNPDFLRDNILLFGPGFLFVKLVYLFGEQRRRLEWEWVVWSLVAGLPISFGAEWIATGQVPSSVPSTTDPAHAILRFGLAIVAAALVVIGWRLTRHSGRWPMPFLRRSLSDSAWDMALDEAAHKGSGVALTVARIDDDGVEGEVSFYGNLKRFGYEAASAEPILVLSYVSRWSPDAGTYVALSRSPDDMMVFHRDRVLRMRIWSKQSSDITGKENAAKALGADPYVDE